MGLKKFINSFTSYQFPNPFPPQQDPLSRLEFPIDQWFMGLATSYAASSFLLAGECWLNVTRESAFKMLDSDWTDEAQPSQKTVFSESQCRLDKGLLFDAKIAPAISADPSWFFRPVAGWRYQYFRFTTHDGYQWDLDGDQMELPGDGIVFEQTFNHLYVGGLFNFSVAAARFISSTALVKFEIQLDYAEVSARNEDLHLLRAGHRVTVERTRGHCWHASLSARLISGSNLGARIEADFKRVLTRGGHQLTNPLFNLDFSFDGAKVWSDQASIAAVGEYRF